ncbi:phage tail family protein [Clostridium estertheticum]|uniref:phage distal tail protein n=1 Tax=Clostridium estertheticum TaxID=238834 RepID=UPI001CF50103|nr:phage tail domain-containing protein [Clostridium estertheticum]MCB2308894.1 phage tail family protein [Clostridium estertheticum]MCB2347306.1 phage tail family protein [Clostridium estertheticum]MCB2351927.1 phage tail family protein [Clostridium estertheticum]WAG48506.1 phage tail family protein [Clostridium estertheticum]
MLINNINISNFKAKLMDRKIVNAKFEIINEWVDDSLNPFVKDKDNLKYKYKTLTFTLDVICRGANELETMKSNLTKQLAISTIKFDDIDFYYRGFVIDDITPNYIMEGNETLDITMLVIAEKTEVIEIMNRVTSKTINVTGNTETPCIVEITASIDTIDIILEGFADDPIIIKNLKANKTVIVDGESQTVTVDGINKYGDSEMWDFPSLSPGNNNLKFSRNNCDIKVKYKPRFI